MIARKSLVTFGNNVLGAFIGLFAIVAIGRFIQPEILGQVAYPLALLGLLHYVTALGFNKAHIKRVSEGEDEADCFATFAVFKVVTTAVFILFALGLYWYQFHVRGVGFYDIAVTAYFFVLAHFALLSLRSTFHYTFEARTEAARTQSVLLLDTLVRVSTTIVVATLFAAVTKHYGPLAGWLTTDNPFGLFIAHYPAGALAATYALGTGASLILAAVSWKRSGGRVGRFRWDLLKGYWAFAFPLLILGIVTTISGKIDRVALGYFVGDEFVGYYDLPKRFTALVDAIPVAVAAILFPSISAMNARGERARVRETTEQSLRYLSMIVLPIATFVALFADGLLRLIGEQYLPGAAALAFLTFFAFVMALARPLIALTTGLGRSDLMARAGIAMALTNIVLNVVLIPEDIRRLGVNLPGLKTTGAALATLISGFVGLTLLWLAARSVVGAVRFPGLLRHVIAAVLMGAFLRGMHLVPVLAFNRWYDLVTYMITGAAVYFLVLWVLRELTREDVRFFLNLASVRQLLKYVRSELK